jgi:hypothetical protein
VISGVFDASPQVSLSIFTGAELNGKLKLKNEFGEVVDESSYDPTAIFGVSFGFRF